MCVCVPFSAWHRQPARHVLKAKLTKPSTVEVLPVPDNAREELPDEDKCMKVWIGLITHELVKHVHWDEDPGSAECAFTLDGAPDFVPSAKSLADAASEHFSFLSAESMEPSQPDGPGSQKLDSRTDRLELVVENLPTTFQTFLSQQPSEQRSAKPVSSRQAASSKAAVRKPALGNELRQSVSGSGPRYGGSGHCFGGGQVVSGEQGCQEEREASGSLRWQTCKSAVRERGRGPRRSRRAWVCSNYI